MVTILDNYDSFTFNLMQYVGSLGIDVCVVRNNKVSVEELMGRQPEAIVVSPGPGRPEDAGISIELIRAAAGSVPVLGVCLGHQALAVAFGAKVIQAPEIVHGKTSPITCNSSPLFDNLPSTFSATRYHSLIVDEASLPATLKVIATSDTGLVMALQHREYPLFGVQFHPESIATDKGLQIIQNFLSTRIGKGEGAV